MHKFSKDDIPQDWHELLGDYFETVQWHQLQKNLQAELDLHSEHIRPEPEYFFKALQEQICTSDDYCPTPTQNSLTI